MYLARVVVAFKRVRPQDPRFLAVEHSPGPLGAEATVSAVDPGHVLQSKVARWEVEVRRVERHEQRQQLVLHLVLEVASTRVGRGGGQGQMMRIS